MLQRRSFLTSIFATLWGIGASALAGPKTSPSTFDEPDRLPDGRALARVYRLDTDGKFRRILRRDVGPGDTLIRIGLDGDRLFMANLASADSRGGIIDPADGEEAFCPDLDKPDIDLVHDESFWRTGVKVPQPDRNGLLFGCYNQRDKITGELIPQTIRSPFELTEMCLKALGETGYSIDMPPGIDSIDAKGPRSLVGVNPPIVWEGVRPGVALQELCDLFGRQVVWNAATDTMRIEPKPLTFIPAYQAIRRKEFISVKGTPENFHFTGAIETVGEDWDGTIKPIDALS